MPNQRQRHASAPRAYDYVASTTFERHGTASRRNSAIFEGGMLIFSLFAFTAFQASISWRTEYADSIDISAFNKNQPAAWPAERKHQGQQQMSYVAAEGVISRSFLAMPI